jgi:hypothetical protein
VVIWELASVQITGVAYYQAAPPVDPKVEHAPVLAGGYQLNDHAPGRRGREHRDADHKQASLAMPVLENGAHPAALRLASRELRPLSAAQRPRFQCTSDRTGLHPRCSSCRSWQDRSLQASRADREILTRIAGWQAGTGGRARLGA